MSQKSELTLEGVRKSEKLREPNVVQASDFLSDRQKAQIIEARTKSRVKKRKFDNVDSYIAEMIARFGYDFYKDWKAGIIPNAQVSKMILAERARDKQRLLSIEGIIIAMVGPTIQRQKGKPAPKSPKVALSIFKEDSKIARGE